MLVAIAFAESGRDLLCGVPGDVGRSAVGDLEHFGGVGLRPQRHIEGGLTGSFHRHNFHHGAQASIGHHGEGQIGRLARSEPEETACGRIELDAAVGALPLNVGRCRAARSLVPESDAELDRFARRGPGCVGDLETRGNQDGRGRHADFVCVAIEVEGEAALGVGLAGGAPDIPVAEADVGDGLRTAGKVETGGGGDGQLHIRNRGAGRKPLAHGRAEAPGGNIFQSGGAGLLAVGIDLPSPYVEVRIHVGMGEDGRFRQRVGKRLEVKVHGLRNDLGRLGGFEADEIIVGARGRPDGVEAVVVELERVGGAGDQASADAVIVGVEVVVDVLDVEVFRPNGGFRQSHEIGRAGDKVGEFAGNPPGHEAAHRDTGDGAVVAICEGSQGFIDGGDELGKIERV